MSKGPKKAQGSSIIKKAYTYILECSDSTYYTGSTTDLDLRLAEHQAGEGANYTKTRLPVKLVYYEEYLRIDEAFYREKQIQGWRRAKKEALIKGMPDLLPDLALSYGGFDGSGLRQAQPPNRPKLGP